MSTHSIPFFNYPHVFTSHEEDFIDIFREVGKRGAFIAQRDLREFEANLAEYTGARQALGFSNATDGLHIALRAAGIGPGDEVIFCSHTMVATGAAIHFAGATPVPVECGPDHLMDPESAAAAVTDRTRALMPTQLNGRTCDMDALQSLADKHDLVIIEDASQALGSKYKERQAGTFGLAGAISFYPAKNLGCLGDGGAVLTNDEEMYRKMFLLRDHGRDNDGEVVMWGLNTRLDNVQAAFLNFKLARYQQETERRRAIARLYQERLGHLSQLVLPPAADSDPNHFDVFQNYEIEAEQRDELKAFLHERGIGTLIQWGGKAVHQFEKLGFQISLPFTERMFTRCLMLPINTSLRDIDAEYVSDAICEFYA
jgi:dTDP-4-amino-4,6-dideoxygalactose transaminase